MERHGSPTGFIDESQRGSRDLLCIVYVWPSSAAQVRKGLRRMLLPGQRRLHLAKEQSRRRRAILATIARMPVAYALESRKSSGAAARAASMTALLTLAPIAALIIESRGSPLDAEDRRVITPLLRPKAVKFVHCRPYQEPLLWLPDAVAWAYGAGGEWRRHLPRRVR